MSGRVVYDNYEIQGCVRRDDGGGEYVEVAGDGETPDFWTLYGHIDGQGVEAIGDFDGREAAETVYYRITGQPFGSHEEIADRLRLMHAAPVLLEALEPYAIEAINLMQMANGEDNEDVADHIASKLVHAYTEASPKPPGADAVTRQIERLVEAGYLEDWGDPSKVWPDFAGMHASHIPRMMLAWEGLDRSQQERMLEKYVHWDGFDHPSGDRVTRNVLDGRPKEEWFAGLDTRLRAKAADASQPMPPPERTAPTLLDAVKLAQTALNTAPRFRVGDTDSYEIAAIVDQAIAAAAGPTPPLTPIAELEARVEGYKHLGNDDPDPGRYRRWGDFSEEAKFDQIMGAIRDLRLESEPAAYRLLAREVDLTRLPEGTQRDLSRAERESFAAAIMEDGFNWRPEPGRPTRPGPEETPLERVERQIGHIKVIPDPHDFRIEELGPWDTEVSAEWKQLPEADKLARLVRQVDWRDISPEDKQRLLGREVDFARVLPPPGGGSPGPGGGKQVAAGSAADRPSGRTAVAEGAGDAIRRIRRELADHHHIAIFWNVDDVRSARPDFDDDRAWELLLRLERDHDGDRGITWGTIDSASREMFPEPDPFARAWARSMPSPGDRPQEARALPSPAGIDADRPGQGAGKTVGRPTLAEIANSKPAPTPGPEGGKRQEKDIGMAM